MDVSQLRYFVETVRTGSYRKAAGNLYLTAQGVAQSVKRLETELGTKLLEKRGRNVVPTEKAMELYPYAQQLLAELLAFETRARLESSTTGRTVTKLAISEAPLRGCLFVHDTLRQNLEREMPNIAVTFVQNEMAIQALQDNLVDAAVVLGRPDDDIISVPLCSVEPYVIATRDSLDLDETGMALSSLEGRRIAMPTDASGCYRFLSASLEAHHVKVRFDIVGSALEDHLAFITNGGIVFSYGHSPLLRCNNLIKVTLDRNTGIVFPFFLCTKETRNNAQKLCVFLQSQANDS